MVADSVERTDIVNKDPPLITNLLIFDRSNDMITPLCTQLTYEGLIDEKLGINSSNPLQLS